MRLRATYQYSGREDSKVCHNRQLDSIAERDCVGRIYAPEVGRRSMHRYCVRHCSCFMECIYQQRYSF